MLIMRGTGDFVRSHSLLTKNNKEDESDVKK